MLINWRSGDDDTSALISALYCVYEVESAKLKVESWRDNRGLLDGQANQLLRRIPMCVETAFWLSENARIISKQYPEGRADLSHSVYIAGAALVSHVSVPRRAR